MEKSKERRDREERLKLAALASGKFDPAVLFPENFKSSKPAPGPHSLKDPNDDIDYSEVEWETPEQDEWLKTQKLLMEHQESKVSGSNIGSSDVPEFDKDIPILPPEPSVPMDADDIEWG